MAIPERLRGLNKSCNLLIVINGMERFAFKGVASNLVSYLTDIVKMSNSAAAKTVNSWCGLTSIMPLLVVPLADSYCDTYSTIFASSSLYALGLMALTSAALASVWSPQTNTSSRSVLFASLCLISLAQGGYNPSLQAFGADQLETNDELPCSTTTTTTKDDKCSRDTKSLFFQWWYYGVCTGSLLGVTVMSYIQDTFGWVLGFALPLLSMVFSILLFACGNRIYRFRADESYMHNKSFKGMVYSIKESVAKLSHTKSKTMELELEGKSLCSVDSNIEGHTKIAEKGFYMNKENVKDVVRLLPIWVTLLMFAVIFQLPATFFTKQGMTMKREIGKFKIPPATLQSAITISILVLMPLYDKILIPSTRLVTRNEKGISVTQRMGIGMFLSIVAMIIAALVETRRLAKSKTESLSIFLLLPQYILLGISDIFTVVGMQEFFYGEVPVKMKRMGIALNTSVFGVGSFMSAGLISLVEFLTTSCSSSGGGGKGSWFSDDLREARLDKYYWLLTLLSAFSFFFYVFFCKCFKSRNELVEDE